MRHPLTDDGPDADDGLPGPDGAGSGPLTDPDTLDDSDAPESGTGEGGESFRELRPPRRLRLWQLAPIVALAALGSLMFAFPLAFELGGDGGAMIAMLGLLLCCCAAGWGMMAARRVGHTWPGLPARGSGRRADWRVVLLSTPSWWPSRHHWPSGAWPGCAEPRPRRNTAPGRPARGPHPVRCKGDQHAAPPLPQGPRHRERLRDRPRPGRPPRPARDRRRQDLRPAGRTRR